MAKEREERPLLIDPWTIIQYPLLTEKSLGKVETENKLVFIVRRSANKIQIRWAVERAFDVKVAQVRTQIDRKGRKKAFVKLTPEYRAVDIAMRFGML
jgi:ribosomal protein uL23